MSGGMGGGAHQKNSLLLTVSAQTQKFWFLYYILIISLSLSFFFLSCKVVVVVGLVPKSCLTLVTPWTITRQAPLSMEFPRQKYGSGLPFPSPGESFPWSLLSRDWTPSPALQVFSCIAHGFFTEPPIYVYM